MAVSDLEKVSQLPEIKRSQVARCYYIDWLRVAAVLLLIPYHTGRVFDVWKPFYVKNGELSEGLSAFLGLLNPWFMPLLFVLAGASSWFALNIRSSAKYLKERFSRLLVPFLFGLGIIVPPQAYLALLKDPSYHQSFWQFYPSYFRLDLADLSGYFGTFTPGHLWFILYLFVLSLVALPFFSYLKTTKGQSLLNKLASFFQKPAVILVLPTILLLVLSAMPDLGGKNPFYYLGLFVFGFILMSDQRFSQAIDCHIYPALTIGLGATIASTILALQNFNPPDLSWGDVLKGSIFNVGSWFMLVGLLGLGQKYLNFSNRRLQYLNAASYPIYILHQTVIIVVAYFVVALRLPILVKFALIACLGLIFTLGLYEGLVKRINLARFAFGLKLLKSTQEGKRKF